MSETAFPDLARVLPHRGPMCLLDRVLEHSPEQTTCALEVGDSAIFARADGRVPVWVTLEYMAQCAAAHAGLVARASGEAPRPGLFLGSRRVLFEVDDFEPGQRLRVSARPLRRSTRGFATCACRVRASAGGELLAQAELKLYVPEDLESLILNRPNGA